MSAVPSLGLNAATLLAGNDDEDLYESLARARKAAEKQMQGSASSQAESFAEQLASRREQDEAAQAMDTEKAASRLLHCQH